MGYLELLRGYLERVERSPEGARMVRLDMAVHRSHFLAEQDGLAPPRDRWERRERDMLGDGLDVFIQDVAERLVEELLPDAPSAELARLIDIAISLALGASRTSGSEARDRLILSIVGAAKRSLLLDDSFDGWRSLSRYAFEVNATRRNGDRYVITRMGSIFLDMVGIDAVRWILALEAVQTLGPSDDWRLSSELAAQLLREPQREFRLEEFKDDQSWYYSFPTIRRLAAMQLIHYEHADRERRDFRWSYRVFERARPFFEEIAEQRPTPFAVLADALLRDDAASTLDAVRPVAGRALHESAAAATALQARMVVHEIRNALVPARSAFLSLMEELDEPAQPEPLQRYQRRVHEGISQALSFSENMLRVANLGIEPVAPFDLVVAIKEAIAAVAWALNGSLRYSAPEGALRAVGPQTRFIMAVANLLRNAAQAIAGREGVVEVSVEATAGRVVLRVDDDGPGVPVEQRRMIFEQGVTLRSGGSGQGLALVRQVIEGEMRGTVSCGDSPLGGARFEIVIPVEE